MLACKEELLQYYLHLDFKIVENKDINNKYLMEFKMKQALVTYKLRILTNDLSVLYDSAILEYADIITKETLSVWVSEIKHNILSQYVEGTTIDVKILSFNKLDK